MRKPYIIEIKMKKGEKRGKFGFFRDFVG